MVDSTFKMVHCKLSPLEIRLLAIKRVRIIAGQPAAWQTLQAAIYIAWTMRYYSTPLCIQNIMANNDPPTYYVQIERFRLI